MATAEDGAVPETGQEVEADADQTLRLEAVSQEPVKAPRGHVGAIYADIFKDLYPASPAEETQVPEGDPDAGEAEAAAPPAEAASEANSKTGEAGGCGPSPWAEIDLSAEDDEIAAIHAQLQADHERIDKAKAFLQEKWENADQLDEEHREYHDKQPLGWEMDKGLIIRDDIPIPDSQLRNLLHHGTMQEENLAIPRTMMHDVERNIAIKTGVLPEHDNLLAVSKPDAPNYFKDTASNQNRMFHRNIQPRLTDAQRTLMVSDIDERNRQRPPMPKVLNAEERLKNLAIIKKMQTKVSFLRNPRFIADQTAAQKGEGCPFRITPECITFRNYDVGGVYEVQVVLRNASGIGRHLRIMPCKSEVFSNTPITYDGEAPTRGAPSSVVTPGMAARFSVRFAPMTLNDQTDEILIRTELGDFALPVYARRVQPMLEFDDPVNIGCILAGQFATKTFTITNRGGEGSFRLIPAKDGGADEEVEHHYETPHDSNVTTFVSPNFRLEPATFYLEVNQSIDIKIHFSATSTRQFTYPLQIEGDNGERVPLTLIAISDAVRLELLGWPSIPNVIQGRSPESHESPWALVPWQMSWQQPGVQVGSSESQTVDIANGGYLPVKVQWRFVEPPKALLSHLAVGGKQRLSDDIMKNIHRWPVYDPAKHGLESCPFIASPASATLPPFSKASFSFSFYAYKPVNHCSTVFAYLAAIELPDSRHCLLHHNDLQQLQETMRPSGYKKGLPLFGGAVSALVDTEARAETPGFPSRLTSSCAVTAVCLSGRSVSPKVTCLPPLVGLSGDVLPFVSHEREVILRNTGKMPAFFRFRLTSQMPASSPDLYDPLWIVAAHEVPARPDWQPPESAPEDPAEQLRASADRLGAQWPPLPPFRPSEGAEVPGFGALATVCMEPHCGCILPGGFIKISVTLRIAQECDIDAHLLVDLPTSLDDNSASVVPPMKIRVIAAARAPRVEVRGISFLDYGVVRAHSRHTLKLRLDNPSDMPTVVRLRHRNEGDDECKIVLSPQYTPEGPPTTRSALGDAPKRATPRTAATPRGGKAAEENPDERDEAFPVESHEDVVDLFVNAMKSGDIQGCLPIRDTEEARVEPWVHARSGCLDQSGRKKHQFRGRGAAIDIPEDIPEDDFVGVPDNVDFIFQPECVALWPHQSSEVDVILRTRFVGQYDALVEVAAFDSGHSQCVAAEAEVQLPRLRLSTQHAHFDITYVKVASPMYELELFNDYDMPAPFHWKIPVKLEAGIEVQIAPDRGVVPPRSSMKLKLLVVPTRESEHANLLCQVFTKDVMQPLVLQVSARVYGPEVDYALVPAGEEPPVIKHLPRMPEDELGGTYQVSVGKAPADSPTCNFGEMELQKTKTMHLVLYNRTGIPTPFGIKIDKYGAWDPISKGKKIGGLLEAATRMYSLTQGASPLDNPSTMGPDDLAMQQTFSNEPQVVAGGRQPSLDPDPIGKDPTKQLGSSKKASMPRANSRSNAGSGRFDPKQRKNSKLGKSNQKQKGWLLDDKHELQAFRSDVGADFALQKELKEQGMVALKCGNGYAVTVEPKSDWLQPFSRTTITCTCYSDLPGPMEDELIISIGQLQSHAEGGDYRIPLRVLSCGNPLYVPDQQVGLIKHVGDKYCRNILDPPRLLMETITPAAGSTVRTIKVGNNSMTQVHVSWKIMSQLQVRAVEDWKLARQAASQKNESSAIQNTEAEDREGKEEAAEDRELTEEEAAQKAADVAAAAQAGDGEEVAPPVAEVPEPDQDKADAAAADGAGAADEGEQKEGENLRKDDGEASAELAESGQDVADGADATKGCEEEEQEAVEEVVPQVEDPFALENGEPPIRIEPQEALLPVQGMATFTVTMLASRATTTSEGHYQYRLIGEGRYAQDTEMATKEEVTTTAWQNVAGPEVTQKLQLQDGTRPASKLVEGVARLPEIQLDDAELQDDDSDIERIPSGRKEADNTQKHGQRAGSKDEVVQDIISTLTIDCIGDCIVPRLVIDKKCDHEIQEFADEDERQVPVFKFVHSSVAPAGEQRTSAGVKVLGLPGGTPHQGVGFGLMREVALANENACPVYCRFRAEGPFRIKMLEQVGKKPVVPLVVEKQNKKLRPKADETISDDPLRQLFAVPARGTITLQLEFVPTMVPKSQWTGNIEHIFRGDVVVEYPRDHSEPGGIMDLQRVHLLATSRKPSIRLNLIPHTTLDAKVPIPDMIVSTDGERPPLLIEFGYVHVETAIARMRAVLLSSETNVVAKWRIFHVGRKRKPKDSIENGGAVQEEEDLNALDDREAFAFDVSEGELRGPSKDGLVPGSDVRMPKWCPTTPALPKRLPHVDEHLFDPKKVIITFKPSKNEAYRCRFRVQVESGRSFDFICRGHGSYSEEDDAMEYQEA